jgi:hypothetical protein
MSSNNQATVVVPRLVELTEVTGYDPHARLGGVAAWGMLVDERPHVGVQDSARHGRHRAPVELLEKIGALIHVIASLGQTFRREVIKWSVYAGSGGGLSVTLVTLAVLTILCHGDSSPTPTPTPIPF